MPKRTHTSSFGVSRREGHDASAFYARSLYQDLSPPAEPEAGPLAPPEQWSDRIYCQSSEQIPLPDSSVALAFTSPPYNVGKDYDKDISLEAYLDLIGRVGREVFRVLQPGGRYVINIANLGRKPYIPLHAWFYHLHQQVGFLPMGEIIWQKARGASGSCAWGSWRSAKSPRLRDLHEYLLVFARQSFSRPDKGPSDITADEFMEATLSVWNIPAESAKRVGHPAPFPLALAERVIRLYSYLGDVILDPFAGSGTTCLAALRLGRHYVGLDTDPAYCALAQKRIAAARDGDS
ncbi:MAG: site-specific DNA-methyltransferase [Anaerolineales bacterium]|nr:site-specific DNA-methyltransferase [Anaerolineales bacterium]